MEDGLHVHLPLAALVTLATSPSLAWNHKKARLGPGEEWSSDRRSEKKSPQETWRCLRPLRTWMARLRPLRTWMAGDNDAYGMRGKTLEQVYSGEVEKTGSEAGRYQEGEQPTCNPETATAASPLQPDASSSLLPVEGTPTRMLSSSAGNSKQADEQNLQEQKAGNWLELDRRLEERCGDRGQVKPGSIYTGEVNDDNG
ncbi:hypothetical protein CRENBAI_005605 [Crenichthys baileyi]|uniref:Uncharacterized protein n=1 Tax=Crenichthys baileyi TaxID=28760 RepID=A0AAV9S224_9TELE